ncbi:MAG: MBL fold metallo-hydrolase [Caldiserica bacterium]|nr:MBL fold metallo-hydrolase [Caldisericota bacterium]
MSVHFEALTAHLWAAKCRGYAMNTGILHDAAHATLIDPALLPDEVEDIAAFCEAQQLKVETVVITHHHWDHVLGAARFPGAHVVTHQSYVAQTALDLEHTRRSIQGYYGAEGVAADTPFSPPMPDQTVDRIIGLMVGDMRVQLFHTPGHARDHLSVYDAESAFLWAGDLLSDLEIPFVSDRLDAFERTLGMFAAMQVDLLVPGHGNLTRDHAEIRRRIDADRSYLSDLRTRIEAVVLAGGSVQDATAACADMVFRSPGANSEAHIMNVEQVFLECGGTTQFNLLLGWSREL